MTGMLPVCLHGQNLHPELKFYKIPNVFLVFFLSTILHLVTYKELIIRSKKTESRNFLTFVKTNEFIIDSCSAKEGSRDFKNFSGQVSGWEVKSSGIKAISS